MENKMHMDMWFPSIIWNVMLEGIDNEELVKYGNSFREQDEDGLFRSNRNGYHSQEIAGSDNQAFIHLVNTITEHVEDCAKNTQLGGVELSNIWYIINGKGAYNYPHCHPGSLLSGVYYPYCHPEMGGFSIERTDGAEHYLPPQRNGYNHFNAVTWHYPSETGKLIIFPSWVRHSVEANNTDEERVSISFNFHSTYYKEQTGTEDV